MVTVPPMCNFPASNRYAPLPIAALAHAPSQVKSTASGKSTAQAQSTALGFVRYGLMMAIGLLLSSWAAAQPPASPTTEATESSSGFVLLRNGNVLRGQVEQERTFVNIRRDASAVVRLPATEVLHWAPTLEALYAYRVQHRKPHSLTAWFADAGWCVEQGLLHIAGQELEKLARLAPSDHRVAALDARLKNAVAREAIAAQASATTKPQGALPGERLPRDTLPSHRQGDQAAADPMPATAKTPLAELPPHLLGSFTARVQPLLINRCGQSGCHGGSSSAAWQLDHFGLSSRLPATITRRNLAHLLKWVNETEPATSPLLIRARSPHGGLTTAPLAAGDAKLLSQLQAWAQSVARRSAPPSTVAGKSLPEPLMANAGPAADASAKAPADDRSDRPTRLPPVKDPFNPADFNRMYHRR